MAATDSAKVTSPKVKAIDKWGAIGGVALGILAFFLSSLTPDLFEFLGPWAGIVTATLVFAGAAIARIAAYQTPDPLRSNYTAQETAFELQRQREEAGTNSMEVTSLPPDEWATRQWPDNKG